MQLRTLPTLRRRLTATSTTEVFEALTDWYHSLECANALQVVLILANKTGNFQCRLGLQTATATIEDLNTPLNPASVSTQVTTAPTRSFLRFDPNGASDGNIDTAAYFRVGVIYSLSAGAVSGQGDVALAGMAWR